MTKKTIDSNTITRAMRDGYPSLAADPKTGMRPGYNQAAEEAGVNHWAPRHPYEMEGRVYAQYGDLLRKGWRPVLAAEAFDPAWRLLGWMHKPQRRRLEAAAEAMKTQRYGDGVAFQVFDTSYTVTVYDADPHSATLELEMARGVAQKSDDSGNKAAFTRKPPTPPQTVQMGDVQGSTYGITYPRDVENGLQPITTGLVRYACPDGSAGMMVPLPYGAGYRSLPQGWSELARAIVDGLGNADS